MNKRFPSPRPSLPKNFACPAVSRRGIQDDARLQPSQTLYGSTERLFPSGLFFSCRRGTGQAGDALPGHVVRHVPRQKFWERRGGARGGEEEPFFKTVSLSLSHKVHLGHSRQACFFHAAGGRGRRATPCRDTLSGMFPDKSFGKGEGEREGERENRFSKRFPSPSRIRFISDLPVRHAFFMPPGDGAGGRRLAGIRCPACSLTKVLGKERGSTRLCQTSPKSTSSTTAARWKGRGRSCTSQRLARASCVPPGRQSTSPV